MAIDEKLAVVVTPALGPVPAIYVPRWPTRRPASVWQAVRHLARHPRHSPDEIPAR